MKTNGSITLWHDAGYDPKTRMELPPMRQYFADASIQNDVKVTVDSGLKTADVLKIRIPGAVDIKIKNGDRVMLGECLQDTPPDNAFVVKGFADNRKGTRRVWHWKVICG